MLDRLGRVRRRSLQPTLLLDILHPKANMALMGVDDCNAVAMAANGGLLFALVRDSLVPLHSNRPSGADIMIGICTPVLERAILRLY
jgi:hypothetical protein